MLIIVNTRTQAGTIIDIKINRDDLPEPVQVFGSAEQRKVITVYHRLKVALTVAEDERTSEPDTADAREDATENVDEALVDLTLRRALC